MGRCLSVQDDDSALPYRRSPITYTYKAVCLCVQDRTLLTQFSLPFEFSRFSLFHFSDSDTKPSSHLAVIHYSEVFEVILNCLQYVSGPSPLCKRFRLCLFFSFHSTKDIAVSVV